MSTKRAFWSSYSRGSAILKIPKRVKGNKVEIGTRLIAKADLYGELLGYAKERGRKDGWVSHSFRELTGVWPNAYKASGVPIPPSFEVLTWIKSKDIRYAKSNKGNGNTAAWNNALASRRGR